MYLAEPELRLHSRKKNLRSSRLRPASSVTMSRLSAEFLRRRRHHCYPSNHNQQPFQCNSYTSFTERIAVIFVFDSPPYFSKYALRVLGSLAVEDVAFRVVTEELSAHYKKRQGMSPETVICSFVGSCAGFILVQHKFLLTPQCIGLSETSDRNAECLRSGGLDTRRIYSIDSSRQPPGLDRDLLYTPHKHAILRNNQSTSQSMLHEEGRRTETIFHSGENLVSDQEARFALVWHPSGS